MKEYVKVLLIVAGSVLLALGLWVCSARADENWAESTVWISGQTLAGAGDCKSRCVSDFHAKIGLGSTTGLPPRPEQYSITTASTPAGERLAKAVPDPNVVSELTELKAGFKN